ncbi:hypothetical protein [Neorhizobium sp. DT-125]|uniref:hypothetical protein n=1 Tax=Neorhizobium sp. DT-125 TaxID=3396163 RepID=UPI003F1C346B
MQAYSLPHRLSFSIAAKDDEALSDKCITNMRKEAAIMRLGQAFSPSVLKRQGKWRKTSNCSETPG